MHQPLASLCTRGGGAQTDSERNRWTAQTDNKQTDEIMGGERDATAALPSDDREKR